VLRGISADRSTVKTQQVFLPVTGARICRALVAPVFLLQVKIKTA